MEETRRRMPLWTLWLLMGCIGLLGGCSGAKQSVRRELSENEHTFCSSASPRVTLTLPAEWEYLGKVEEAEYDAGIGTAVEALTYFWGSLEKKSVPGGFLVRVLSIPDSEDLRWDEQIFSSVTKKLESGSVEIEEESYEYLSTIFPEPLTKYEERFVTNAGYKLPHFFLVHALGQLDSSKKTKSYLLYFQHIDPAEFNGLLKKFVSDEWDEAVLSEDEQQVLKEFLEQFREHVQFLAVEK
jgi:hypothetical protein